MIFLPNQFLSVLFGEDYVSGAAILVILSKGYLNLLGIMPGQQGFGKLKTLPIYGLVSTKVFSY